MPLQYRAIKKFVCIVFITFLSLLAVILLIYLLLWLPPVQQKVKDIALEAIMKKTHNQISMGGLKFRPFNRLLLEEVYVEDLNSDTLLSVNTLSASFDLWELFDHRLRIHSVELDEFVIHINKKDPDAAFNFQFLIDALASEKQDTTTSSMIIQIEDISLKNGQIHYDLLSETAVDPERLDFNHIHLSGLKADINFHSTGANQWNVSVNQLSFNEKSGFILDQLQAEFISEGDRIRLDQLQIHLPHSEISITGASLVEKTVSVTWEDSRIDLHDIRMFYPRLALLDDAGTIYLTGKASGTLADMQVNVNAQTGRGSLLLTGEGGYDPNARTTRFDVALKADNVDVRTILQDTLFRKGSFQLQAKGEINASGKIDITGNAGIERFDFNGYGYHQIQANATYRNERLQLEVHSHDANMPLELQGWATFRGKRSMANIHARLDSVYLDPLNLPTHYKQAYLSTVINAGVNGFDPEQMALDIYIDQFLLHTDKGSFREPAFKLCYLATDSCTKQLDVSSQIVNGNASGRFTYAGVVQSFINAFPALFPHTRPQPKLKDDFANHLNFRFSVNNAHSLTKILELPEEVPDSALVIGKYNDDGETLRLSASAYTQFLDKDTLQLSVSLSNKANNLAFIFNVDNKSTNYDLDGSIDAEVAFILRPGTAAPDMQISLNPTVIVLNETGFNLHPAQIEVREQKYIVHDLLLEHAASESLCADGVISAQPDDSLKITVSQFRLGTIFNVMKTRFPLSGTANGEILGKRLLSTPLVLSRGFSINNIVFAGIAMGDLTLRSAWSSERKGLVLRANLAHEDHPQSVVSGFILPEKDSLSLNATIRDMELKWLNPFVQGSLYGLDGSLNADMRIAGKITQPVIDGIAYFDTAKAGITMLNTLYTTSDTVTITPDAIHLKRFTIKDKDNRTLVANGKIAHRRFSNFNPAVSLSLSNFLALDNAQQTDSLLFGNLRINGLLNIKKNNNNWLLSGDITHSDDSKVMVNIPPATSMAEHYNSLTFINIKDIPEIRNIRKKNAKFSFPLKIAVSFWLDPSLTVGAVFNPATGDAAQVKGTGSMNFSYDLNNASINLLGDYTVESGKTTLSLANIARKTFTVQEGGKLTFTGNPMSTIFNLTAIYGLRADLTSLDQGFGSLGLASTKIPVECSLTATGNLDNMNLKYNIILPNQPDEIQRRIESLLYTDDLKIKEIAYLLAFGTFMPANSDNQTATNWTSLASAPITTQLNNLLSRVLAENWSVGTDVYSSDGNFNDMNMAVNVSTRLLNNRLTINSTLGYSSDPGQTDNFTGDFEVEYKLIPSGNILLKAYNVTNNQYFEQAKMTQGVGIVYKRNARTFNQLFERFKKKK